MTKVKFTFCYSSKNLENVKLKITFVAKKEGTLGGNPDIGLEYFRTLVVSNVITPNKWRFIKRA